MYLLINFFFLSDEGEIETARTHRKIFDVKDGESYVFYVKTRNKIGESKEIKSKTVRLKAHHHIVARGNRGIDEMVDFLDNTKAKFYKFLFFCIFP